MNTILLSMSIDEDPEEDDELSLTTVGYSRSCTRLLQRRTDAHPIHTGVGEDVQGPFRSNSKRTETSLRLHNKTRIWWRVSNSFTTADD
jgi:hypothetical protein